VACGVSGGADSLALAWLLARWCAERGKALHILTVDHGLRPEAADEARYVAALVAGWPGVSHHILTYDGDKPDSAVQEEARALRYALIAAKCAELGVRVLALAHHQDDQGETVLFRLAKGSGLDGLCAMRPVQYYSEDLTLIRPLLDVPKAELVTLCEREGLDYIDDPSNDDPAYARVRLRAAREVLEAEGMTNKRLALSARRLQRAQEALEQIAEERYETLVNEEGGQLMADVPGLRALPEEVAFRIVLRMVRHFRQGARYNPRMEKLEALFGDLYHGEDFRKRTLAGLMFECLKDGPVFLVYRE